MYALFLVPVPPGVVTATSTVPADPAGASAVIVVELTTMIDVAGLAPNDTAVAPVKPVPVNVMAVPADSGPATGEMDVTTGMGAYRYNWFGRLVPCGDTTTTLALPADPAGATALNVVAVTLPEIVAAVPFTVTDDAPVNPVPEIVNNVPSVNGPATGVTLETYNGFVTRFSLAYVTNQLVPSLKIGRAHV